MSSSPASVTPLLAAISSNDFASVHSLTSSTTLIHHLPSLAAPSAYPITPLQLALSQSSPSAVQALLFGFFQTKSKGEEGIHIQAVLDELIQKIYPQHKPHQVNALSVVPHPIGEHRSGDVIHKREESSGVESEDDLEIRMDRALSVIRAAGFVVVCDSADRENEGDLIIAAEKATPEKLAFMVNETSGLICVGITAERVSELELPQMVPRNTESHQTAFTVSVDYKIGTTTGISASDRALTIRALASPSTTTPASFTRPGHIFPLRAKPGGVLERPGHTEASVDLARMAGLYPAGALCEIVNKDGSMSRPGELKAWAKRYGLEYIDIRDIIEYRKRKEGTQIKSSSSIPNQ